MALTTIQAVYDEARSALEAGKEERAINLSEYVLESFPNFLEAYRILGESHLNRQELEQAASAFQRVLRSDPENIPVHVGLGVTYERQGDLAGAIREFEQAFEIKPDLPELRTQLLRLYNEAWGKEHAHLRMKKVGLARMYVRGRNYTKAIQEFNDVLAHEPDRLDVQVALAEALWRNGEEQEAAELSREILARDPDVLKANLIAGYYALAQGDPKGKQLWQTAQRLDPTQGVAYALFDGMLPPVEAIDTKIESFNEEAWKAAKAEQQRREQAERDRIEREQQAAERAERERLEAEQRRIEAEQRQSVTTPAFAGGGSWLDEVETPSVDIAASDDFDDDDFLRQLLMGVDAAPPAPKVEPVVEQAQPAVEAPATAVDDFNLDDIGLDVTPFSLEDFDDQPKTTNQAVATPSAPVAQNPFATMHLTEPDMPQTSSNTSDEPDMTPFSLTDLGLDEDEIAQFQASETPTTPASTSDEPDMTPFSLTDLGLDDDEIAQFQTSASSAPGATAVDDFGLPSDLEPFSFGDWDEASLDDVPGLNNESSSLPDQLQPFSLDNFDDVSNERETPARDDEPTLPTNIRPFSLAELDLDAIDATPTTSATPFANLDLPTDAEPESTGFSWQEPRSRSTGIIKPAQQESSIYDDSNIFQRLVTKKQTHELAPLKEPSFDPAELDEETMQFFSHDDVDLRNFEEPDDHIAASLTAPTASVSEPDMTPFSLSDLGLSDDEIAQFDVSEAPATPASTSDEPDLTPFSLADLGLSDDEIAQFNLSEAPTTPASTSDEPDMTPFSLADLGLTDDEIAQLGGTETHAAPATSDEPDLTPFSLADLGLTDDEIAQFGMTDDLGGELQPFSLDDFGSDAGATVEPFTRESSAQDDLTPFSLSDLGLSEEEIAAINQADATASDDVYTKMLDLGQAQGYIDLTDIIAHYDDPEAHAEEIDQLAMYLHENGVQIRDGDEIIDMDSLADEGEYVEETELVATDEPDMTPFSLADLGLTDDEIAQVNADSGITTSDEPDMTPFSLADLGLSDDEIAQVNADSGITASDEPDMTPFSLADLGLTDDEIAELNISEAPAAPTTNDEPDMTPFSLADLGLTDDEIAMLDHDHSGTVDQADFARITPATQEAPTSDEPDMTPFSLADLGLTDDEIAMLDHDHSGTVDQADFAGITPATQEAPTSDEPDMTPFSLAELGLSDDEIAAFGGDTALPTGDIEPDLKPFSLEELGLTADEIDSLGLEDDRNLNISEEELESLDFPIPTAEVEPEIVAEDDEEPDMTPFSLEELGLSEDEIAALEPEYGLTEEVVSDAPDMTPFSLQDLGMSADEMNSLDQTIAQAEEPAISEPVVPAVQEEKPRDRLYNVSPRPETRDRLYNVSPRPEPRYEAPVAETPEPVVEAAPAVVEPVQTPATSVGQAPLESKAIFSGDMPDLSEYQAQLAADPENHGLRLALARMAGQFGYADQAIAEYKTLIKHGELLDPIVEDLRDLIENNEEPNVLQRLHRALGDVYSKQGHWREAMVEYSWVHKKPGA